jgi:hypothetical protein
MADVVQLLGGRPPAILCIHRPRTSSRPARCRRSPLFERFHGALTQPVRRRRARRAERRHRQQAFAAGFTNYERAAGPPIGNPLALQPPVGMTTHSPYVLTPRR